MMIHNRLNRRIGLLLLLIFMAQSVLLYCGVGNDRVFATDKSEYVVDEIDYFTSAQKRDLESQLTRFNEENKFDVALLFVDSLDGKKAKKYAADYFKRKDLGYGENKDGLLYVFPLDENEGNPYLYPSGSAKTVFAEEDLMDLNLQFLEGLEKDSFTEEFPSYLESISKRLGEADTSPESTTEDNQEGPKERKPLLIDKANLLSKSEEEELLAKQKKIEKDYKYQAVILTVDSIGDKTSEAFADDYYDYNEYGYGPNRDGMILLLSMEERDYAISTTGYGIKAFTDYGLGYIEDDFLPYFGEDSFYDGFSTYLDRVSAFLEEAKTNKPYDVGNKVSTVPWSIVALSPLAFFLVGLVIAAISNSLAKKKMRPVRPKANADNYVKKDSFNLTRSDSVFLYSTISRVKRSDDDDSGGSLFGGSSTHMGSSGTSHGGSSGKF